MLVGEGCRRVRDQTSMLSMSPQSTYASSFPPLNPSVIISEHGTLYVLHYEESITEARRRVLDIYVRYELLSKCAIIQVYDIAS